MALKRFLYSCFFQYEVTLVCHLVLSSFDVHVRVGPSKGFWGAGKKDFSAIIFREVGGKLLILGAGEHCQKLIF